MTVQQPVSREAECCTVVIPPDVQSQIESKRMGFRRNVFHGGLVCSRCFAESPMKGQRYGNKCHALAMKETRRRKAAELKRLREQVAELSKVEENGSSKAEV